MGKLLNAVSPAVVQKSSLTSLKTMNPHHPLYDLLHGRLDDTEQDGWVDADEEGQNDQRPQRDVFLQVHVGQVAILFPQLTEEHPLNRPEESR
jgi:hypothetical protein